MKPANTVGKGGEDEEGWTPSRYTVLKDGVITMKSPQCMIIHK
jgi:hypothetical protein